MTPTRRLGATDLINYRTTPDWASQVLELTDGRVSDRTLEAYGQVLVDLAWVVLSQQRLGPDGKNA